MSMVTNSQHPNNFVKSKSSQIWSLLLAFDRHIIGKVVHTVTLATSLLQLLAMTLKKAKSEDNC